MPGVKNLWVLLFILQFVNFGATCNNAEILGNLGKRARNYKVDESVETLINDFYLTEGWFSVGDYLMPDNTMIPSHGTCGSFDVIYNQGVNPDINTLTTTPKDITACLFDGFSDCRKTFNIKMRKCGNDIQYYLIRTSSSGQAAYCFDPPELQSVTGISLAPENVNYGQIVVKPNLEFSELTNAGGTVQYTPHLLFECSFNWEDDLHYDVYWYVNGDEVEMYGALQHVQKWATVLKEKTLTEHKIGMGFMIKCGVRARNGKTGMATTIIVSTEFFAGIKIIQSHLTMEKDSFATVRLQLTVPLGCQYHNPKDPCLTGLRMFDPDRANCEIDGNAVLLTDSNKCGKEFKGLKKGEVLDPSRMYEFNVTTTDKTYSDSRLFKLVWKIDEDAKHKIWKGYQPDYVTIQVHEANTYKNKVCYSHVDPHMKSADGLHFENQNTGTYVLYRNTKYPIEVQEKLALCNGNRAWCACGVAIRAGGDLFMINRCSPKDIYGPKLTIPFSEFLSCGDGGILRVVDKSNKFTVYTPIGTIIQITLLGGSYSGLMNIDITMSPKDFRSTEGLCGNFDGIKTNDKLSRPHVTARFPLNWRVRASEDLFSPHLPMPLNRWEDSGEQYYCICDHTSQQQIEDKPISQCEASQYVSCDKYTTYTKRKCNKVTNRKRDLHLKHRREIERLLRLSHDETNDEVSGIAKREVSPVNMTEAEARNICDDAIKGSLAVREFSNHTAGEDPAAVVDQCIFDVMIGGDASLAKVHVEAINDIVKSMFEKDIEYVESNPVNVQYFKKNTCPNNCSNVGNCTVEGTCLCNEHYHGEDCSIDDRVPVEITDLEGGGTCNITDGDGCTCFYFRTLSLLPNFFCHVSGEMIYTTNATNVIPTSVDNGEQEDIFTGICCVPDTSRIRRSTEQDNLFTTRYEISVSNDGVHSGASRSMTVFDSTCQELRHESSDVIVELKDGYCFIDRLCVQDGDTQLIDQRFVCLVSQHRYKWTRIEEDKEKTEITEKNTGLIVGLTVGLTLGMTALVIATIVIKTKVVPKLKQKKSVGDSFVYIK